VAWLAYPVVGAELSFVRGLVGGALAGLLTGLVLPVEAMSMVEAVLHFFIGFFAAAADERVGTHQAKHRTTSSSPASLAAHSFWRSSSSRSSTKVAVLPNPSLHPTFNSRLRRLLPAGELKRWAS
jgi:hypothetical protein